MRKVKQISIREEGRDKGKVFILTEMSATKAELWAMRAFFALVHGGVEVPEDVSSLGMAGIAKLGLKALGGLPFEEAEILLGEMFDCVVYMPDVGNPDYTRRPLEDDIEEVATRLKLRMEVFTLHTGFSFDGPK